MANAVISVESLSKAYRLGVIGTGTFYGDMKRWWAKQRGKPDPYAIIGDADHGNRDGETIWALKDINFSIQQGEAVGIIGRNGAGKSTLLKILSRVTAPTSGEVKVKGRIASLLEVGTGFHPELTGLENIFLNGAIMGMSRNEIKRKFDEIVDFSGVEQFIDTPVKRYSSGMYVRLAFAVAAHLDPDILVVDEVLAVGDMEFQKKCLGKMEDVSKSEGRTILFVSHNMEAVSALCTKALVLHGGQIAYEGNVQAAINAYREAVRSKGISVDHCFSRGGSGGVRITRVWTSSASGDDANKIMPGESMLIHVRLDLHSQYRNKNISVGIAIDAANGKRLFTNVSSWEDTDIVIDSDAATVKCLVKNVALIPGTYLISTSVLFQSETLDCAVHCAEFDVYTKNSEFYVSRDKDQGDMYIPCEFKVLNHDV